MNIMKAILMICVRIPPSSALSSFYRSPCNVQSTKFLSIAFYLFLDIRNCIGQNFALNEMKITCATLLHNFEFSFNEAVPLEIDESLIRRTKKGIHLFIKPINHPKLVKPRLSRANTVW